MNKTLILVTSLIIAGLVVYVVGFLVVANADHHLKYFSLGEDLSQWRDAKDWGQDLEIVGAAITIGAVVIGLLFRRRRGGPAAISVPKEGPAPGTV
jgi:hypothetical protein